MAQVKSIYMIAVCGTGMSALAGLLKQAGYDVSGSDNNIYPPVSALLTNYGIEIKPGFKKENLRHPPDLVVIGNAVSKNNEEVQAVLARGIPYVSFPQALSDFFLKGRKSLVMAGTHGKTTTTSLLGWVLHAAGKNPGIMAGGWMKNFDSNYRLPRGDYFVVEGDEYDTAFFDKEPKFLHYQPYAAILTGIEFDHADIFRDLGHIKAAFRKFVGMVHPRGFVLVEESDANAIEVLDQAPCVVETYGFSERADWHIGSYRFDSDADGPPRGAFHLEYKGRPVGKFTVPMMGRHNARNCAAVAAMTVKLGLLPEEINDALKQFQGIKRRQEVVGEKNGIIVIDDFAHHPTAIHHTLEAVKEAFPQCRVWAVFEPRSATSRRAVFQKSFPAGFRLADRVVIAKLFAPEKIEAGERLDLPLLLEDLRVMGKDAHLIPEVGDIVDFLVAQCKPGDVVLIMSSGGFGGIHRRLLDQLPS
ncbi:MAG: UDP-N-acetylmuramate:L-alanyl-gamma-D-glutamyl-meso-diaminopimelate ligase [Nitrospinales bacterium]